MTLELIKQGIMTNDMNKIRKGYEILSGDKLPERDLDESDFIVRTNSNLGMKNKDNKKRAKTVSLDIKQENSFEDTGTKGRIPKKTQIPKKKKNSGIFIDVTCKNCGNNFTVNKFRLPISIDSDETEKVKAYICDDCIAKRR